MWRTYLGEALRRRLRACRDSAAESPLPIAHVLGTGRYSHKTPMSSFIAYFDESGCHDESKVLAVGGYLVRVDRAARMERKWRAALKKYDIPYFHMVDCAHGNGALGRLSKPQRVEIQTRMIELIKKHATLGFVTISNPRRFSRVHPLPDLYTFSVDACVMAISAWFSDKPPSTVEFIFESGHKNGKNADRYLIAHARSDPDIAKIYQSHRFSDKPTTPLLQAADLLVWQSAKFIRDKVSDARKPRADFVSLIQHPTVFGYVVVQNNTLALTIDNSPGAPEHERDRYIRAVFSDSPQDDALIDEYHAQFAALNARGRVEGKLAIGELTRALSRTIDSE